MKRENNNFSKQEDESLIHNLLDKTLKCIGVSLICTSVNEGSHEYRFWYF